MFIGSHCSTQHLQLKHTSLLAMVVPGQKGRKGDTMNMQAADASGNT